MNTVIRFYKSMFNVLVAPVLVCFISACSDNEIQGSVAETLVFKGICDGSAAVLVDDQSLLVAYDERNSLFLYNVNGGMSLAEFSYQSLLDIDDDEVDVEAVAVAPDGLWWIGSHGLDGSGDDAPNRRVLFKTNAPDSVDSKLQVLEVVTDLMSVILADDNSKQFFSKKVLRKKPKKGGVNIEGLSIAGDGSLLLGFRSPVTSDGGALIVQLIQQDGGFAVVEYFELDLGGRGIRDIQPAEDGFLIIAGDLASGGVFALYQWQIGSKARVLTHLDDQLNPEALVRFGDHWLVISDDGKAPRRDGVICDDIARDQWSVDADVFFRAVKIKHDSLAGKKRLD